jgi:hypothetical protein
MLVSRLMVGDWRKVGAVAMRQAAQAGKMKKRIHESLMHM